MFRKQLARSYAFREPMFFVHFGILNEVMIKSYEELSKLVDTFLQDAGRPGGQGGGRAGGRTGGRAGGS